MRKPGYVFTPYEAPNQTPFEYLFDIFSELVTHTSGDVDEALDWLNVLDNEYKLTSDEYTMEDFIEDLKKSVVALRNSIRLKRTIVDNSNKRTAY